MSTAVTSTTTSPTAATVTTVYIAGSTRVGNLQVTTLWKDGVATTLGQTGLTSYGYGLAVSGSDVYVVGPQNDGTQFKPTLWKNGVATTLSTPSGYGTASGVAISSSGDVYVSGSAYDRNASNGVGYLWKNGVPTVLNGSSYAGGVAVSDTGDVYVVLNAFANSSTQLSTASIWKNGVSTILMNGAGAEEVKLSGNDVYVAGSAYGALNTSYATYWKNGTPVTIGTSPSFIFSVALSGADVYASGYTYAPTVSAVVWKNGMPNTYAGNNASSEAEASVVVNGSLYAVGNSDHGATLWKDGVPTYLDPTLTYIKDNTGSANAISVVQK